MLSGQNLTHSSSPAITVEKLQLHIVHTAVHIYVVIHVQKKTSARCSTPPALLLSLSKYSFSNDGLIMSQRQVKSHRKKEKEKQFPRANLNRYVVCIPHRGILSKANLLATKKQVFTIQNSTAS